MQRGVQDILSALSCMNGASVRGATPYSLSTPFPPKPNPDMPPPPSRSTGRSERKGEAPLKVSPAHTAPRRSARSCRRRRRSWSPMTYCSAAARPPGLQRSRNGHLHPLAAFSAPLFRPSFKISLLDPLNFFLSPPPSSPTPSSRSSTPDSRMMMMINRMMMMSSGHR